MNKATSVSDGSETGSATIAVSSRPSADLLDQLRRQRPAYVDIELGMQACGVPITFGNR